MAKTVRESSAGRSISAAVIMKGSRLVAVVNIGYGNAVTVDVMNYGRARERTQKALERAGVRDAETRAYAQQGRAYGGGYDRAAAALAGLYIDGIRIADHSEGDEKTARMLRAYHKALDANPAHEEVTRAAFQARAARIGARFVNWSDSENRYTSLYLEPGLSRLAALGYQIITAI